MHDIRVQDVKGDHVAVGEHVQRGQVLAAVEQEDAA